MGRAPCCDKSIGLKKGPWTPEEDQKLIDYIQKHGHGSWRTLPKNAGLERCGKSCRLRWANYLRPDIKRGRFSFEEEETIVQLHNVLGNKWSAIAARLPGRTDNEIKNYWNTHIRKRLLRMGIDPVTHRPRLDQLLDFSSVLGSPLCNTNQLYLSRLFGVEQLVNSQILKLASSILSTSLVPITDQNSNLLAHCLEQNQVLHDYGALHLSNATSPLQTTSIVSNLDQIQYFLDVNEPQLLQANNSDQLDPVDLAFCQVAQPNLWQQNDSNFYQTNSIPLTSDQPIINTFAGASNYQQLIPSSSHQDFSFPDLVASMPITSSTQILNSSPTSIHIGSGSTTPSSTCIDRSYTEGERDIGCNTVSFETPGLDQFI